MTTHELRISQYTTEDKNEAIDKAKLFNWQISNNKTRIVRHTAEWIVSKMLSGHTVNFSEVENRTIIMIDIDNKVEKPVYFRKIVNMFKSNGLPPASVITTLSSTADKPRYHIVFTLDRPIFSSTIYVHAVRYMTNLVNSVFPGIADMSVASTTRLFFPGASEVYRSYDSCISSAYLQQTAAADYIRSSNPVSLVRLDIGRYRKSLFKELLLDETSDSYPEECTVKYMNPNDTLKIIKDIDSLSIYYDTFLPPENPYSKRVLAFLNKNSFLHVENYGKTLLTTDFSCLLGTTANTFIDDIFKSRGADGKVLRATITRGRDKIYRYYRYSGRKMIDSFNIFDILGKLFHIDGYKNQLSLAERLFGITDRGLTAGSYSSRIKQNIARLKKLDQYPGLSGYLTRNNGSLIELLKSILKTTDKISRSISSDEHSSQFWITRNMFKAGNVFYSKLAMLYRLGLLIRVKPENYSSYIAAALTSKDHKHTDEHIVYVPEYTRTLLEKAELTAQSLKDDNISESTLSYSQESYSIDKAIALIRASESPILIFKSICDNLSADYGLSNKRTQAYIRSHIKEITEATGYEFTTLTKEFLGKYDFKTAVYPNVTKILYKKEGEEQNADNIHEQLATKPRLAFSDRQREFMGL